MQDEHRIDRLGDDDASRLPELSIEFSQLDEDCIEPATRLSRLDYGGIALRKTRSAKYFTNILRGLERSHESLQTTADSTICVAREDFESLSKGQTAPGKLG